MYETEKQHYNLLFNSKTINLTVSFSDFEFFADILYSSNWNHCETDCEAIFAVKEIKENIILCVCVKNMF